MAIDALATKGRVVVLAAALVLGLSHMPDAQPLTMSFAAAPTSVDPHYHTFAPNNSLAVHIFDTLVDMDEKSRPIPALAESWRAVDDTTWEFKLRRGVKFHNGADFTAEDIAYTFDRVPKVANSPGSFAIYTRPVVGLEIIDPYTVRMKTAGVYPLVPVDMVSVYIIPKGLGANPTTEEFNSGKNAIGTGPYRLLAYRSGDRVELERNDAWWGPKPHWQTVSIRMIPNAGARTASLLAGDVAFTEFVPTADVASLRADKRVALAEANSLRFVYLWLDRSRSGPTPFVTGPNGEVLEKNPLNDLRVRQALSIAINRPAVVDRVMEGAAIATGQFMAPGNYSYVPDAPPPAYDPERAKRLLAEAGFPNGLRITLHGPNDRYVNDGKIIQAIGQMWTRIGVQTTVDAITWPSYIGRANKLEFSAFLLAWGTSSGEASNPLRALIHTPDARLGWGSTNRGRYSNPSVDALIARAMGIADDAERERALIEVQRIIIDDVAMIPLHIQKNIWGMRAGLSYVARADESTRAMQLTPTRP